MNKILKKRRKGRRVVPSLTAAILSSIMAVSITTTPFNVFASENSDISDNNINQDSDTVAFKTAGDDSIYKGLPLFDGVPAHLDAYLDVLCDYIGIEGMLRHALGYQGDYQLRHGEHAGSIIPGSELFGDHIQGVSTDFPAIIALGQSWNRDLIEKVGNVIGTENLYTCDFLDTISNFNAVATTAMQDLRVNPLSGRFDEGFGEDPTLVSELVNAMATGASGIAKEGNEDGFWTQCVVTTKHYTDYAGQQFRRTANVANSLRSVMEQQAKNIKKGIENGSVGGFMTSYGRTAGIPNTISPLVQWMQSFAPWGKDGGTYVVPDYSADSQLCAENAFGNGYDNGYVPSYSDALALMMLARVGHGTGRVASSLDETETGWQDALMAELNNGTLGLTYEDIEKTARAQLIPLIRNGVFNERDEDGYPINYPFTSESLGAGDTAYDYTNQDHQAIALQAAQESIVLLKNDNNILPLSKDAKVAVAGPMVDARFKTTYAVGQTPEIENSGLSISQGIQVVAGQTSNASNQAANDIDAGSSTDTDSLSTSASGSAYSAENNNNTNNISINSDGNILAIKSSTTGKYLVADENGVLTASADTAEAASHFEAYAWGQGDGYSYRCVDDTSNNGLWLKFAEDSDGNIEFGVVGTEELNVKTTGRSATSYSNILPPRISIASNDNGTVNILLDCYSNLFFNAEKAYYKNTRLLTATEDGSVGYTDPIVDKNGESVLRSETDNQFTLETIQETGTVTVNTDADYAVVIVGAPTRHSAGEGNDRSDLSLGKDQYELIDTVSAAYPGKTIVVIDTVYPVLAEEIQNNENVAAILYTPYAGQYDGYAAGQILYGDAAPTGKLTSTWYADMSAFPLLDDYSIPDGTNNTIGLDGLAPRYTVDITQADATANKLTYQYTDAPVTYEFGYGLGYTTYEYGDLKIGAQDTDGNLTASVTVTNTGDQDGAEIVQLYASNPDSTYGEYAPKKRLVAFEKVDLAAGETKDVALTVLADDLALWNSNTSAYEIETGTYTFEAAASSQDIRATAQATIAGTNFDGLDITSAPVYVYDKSFATSGLTYNEYSKAHTAEGLKNDVLVGGYSTVMARKDGAWTALNGVKMDGVKTLTAEVTYSDKRGQAASTDPAATNLLAIEVRLDSPDGDKIAEFTFDPDSISDIENTYTVDAVEDYEVHERGFTEIETELTTEVSGTHDIYLVFQKTGTEIYTIQGMLN